MLRSSKKTDLADVIVYVYDSSDTNSFSYISNKRVMLSPCFSMSLADLPKRSKAKIYPSHQFEIVKAHEHTGSFCHAFQLRKKHNFDQDAELFLPMLFEV